MLSSLRSDEEGTQSTWANWWLLIAVRAAVPIVWLLVVLLEVLSTLPSAGLNLVSIPSINAGGPGANLLVLWIGLIYILPPLSGIALFFDRKYVLSVSDWAPSLLYYLMVIPGMVIPDLIAIIYLYERHKYAGTP